MGKKADGFIKYNIMVRDVKSEHVFNVDETKPMGDLPLARIFELTSKCPSAAGIDHNRMVAEYFYSPVVETYFVRDESGDDIAILQCVIKEDK